MQEHIIEQQGVPGFEDRPQNAGLAGVLLSDLLGDRPLENGALGAGRDDVVQAARDDVHTGSLVAAARQREPDVGRAAASYKGAVLAPPATRIGTHPPQSALLDRDD